MDDKTTETYYREKDSKEYKVLKKMMRDVSEEEIEKYNQKMIKNRRWVIGILSGFLAMILGTGGTVLTFWNETTTTQEKHEIRLDHLEKEDKEIKETVIRFENKLERGLEKIADRIDDLKKESN